MSHIVKGNKWVFVTEKIDALKVGEYGEPYTAKADFIIVNCELHVKGMLSKTEFTREDWEELECHAKNLGFNEYIYCRFKNGEMIKKKKVIK